MQDGVKMHSGVSHQGPAANPHALHPCSVISWGNSAPSQSSSAVEQGKLRKGFFSPQEPSQRKSIIHKRKDDICPNEKGQGTDTIRCELNSQRNTSSYL